MKKIKSLAAVIAVVILVGCATQSATAYKTLSSIQVATSGAYNAYLDLVVQGKVPTNSVPAVSRDYTIYQGVWTSAVAVAATGVTAPATQPVIDAANKVVSDINTAKGTP